LGELYQEIITENSLFEAWRVVGRRPVAHGLDGVDPQMFQRDLDAEIVELARDLASYRFAPVPARQVFVPKGGSEWRELALPSIRDKIVQQAARRAVEPILERTFLDCSYAYRKGKSAWKAIGRTRHELKNIGANWAVKSDVDDFFDTIDHARLFEMLAREIDDADVVRLIRIFVENGVMGATGELRDPVSGVPTGSVLAPLLSNLYLSGFDRYLRDTDVCHVRYADDWVMLMKSKSRAKEASEAVTTYLKERLGLRINRRRQPYYATERGFPFLGFWVRARELRIDRAKIGKTERMLQSLAKRSARWSMNAVVSHLCAKAEHWKRYYAKIDGGSELLELEAHLRQFLLDALQLRIEQEREEDAATWKRRLRRFPWPAPGDGAERLEKAWKEREDQRAREQQEAKKQQATDRAVRRTRRRYRKAVADKTELVIWKRGARLARRGERIWIKPSAKGKAIERPAARVRSVVVRAKGVEISADALSLCAQNDVAVSFLGKRGRPFALLHYPESAQAELLLSQLEAATGTRGLEISCRLVQAKVRNQANLLRYFGKYLEKSDARTHERLDELVLDARRCALELNEIRRAAAGMEPDAGRGKIFAAEGRGAASYWRGVRELVEPDYSFPKRTHRGAKDPINSALNYGYGILYHRIENEIMKSGLHPQIGFLHKGIGKRPSLSFDLIELFRAPVVDRAVIAMVSRREPIEVEVEGRLAEESRRAIADNVLERWRSETPYGGDHRDYGAILRDQLDRIKSVVRGEGRYRPFVQRW